MYVPLPDENARKIIIKTQLAKTPQGKDVKPDVIAGKTEGYSGADVKEVVEMAKTYAIEREIKTHKRSTLLMEDLLRAVNAIRSSVSEEDVVAMNKYVERRKQTA